MIYRLLKALYPKLSKDSKRKKIIEAVGVYELKYNKQFREAVAAIVSNRTTVILTPFIVILVATVYLFFILLASCVCIAAYLADITPVLFSTVKTYKR